MATTKNTKNSETKASKVTKQAKPVENSETVAAPVTAPIMNQNIVQKIEITPKTVLMTLGIIIGLLLGWELRAVFFMFFIAYIINAAFRPVINFLETKKVPRMASIVTLFLSSITVFLVFLITIFSEALTQLTNLISQVPNFVGNIVSNLNNNLPVSLTFLNADVIKESLRGIVSSLLKLDSGVFTTSISSAWGILSFASSLSIIGMMVIIIAIYLLGRKDDLSVAFLKYLNPAARDKYEHLFIRIGDSLGMWLRSQLLLMVSMAAFAWLVLVFPVLFVPGYTMHNYALPIAMFVFIFEIVPGTGNSFGGVLSTVIALASGNIFAMIYIPLVFIITQQIEGMVVIPRVMQKAIGLDPVITILAVIAGYTLFQTIGAVLIIPMIAVVQIVLEFKSQEINNTIKTKIQ